ncbi:substrate-binding domain-containing protein [Neptuniibacter sp. QD72_48]|uniref:substrate-binding domain-containing protein n=1 Tax=unclassified Neptuniibacter TaxID=2630693 RepID=UPI0039F58802
MLVVGLKIDMLKPIRNFFVHLATILIASGLSVCATANDNDQYIRVSDYLLEHPEQRQKMLTFSQIVRNEASPLQTSNEKPIKIAIIYPAEQSSDYWRRSVSTLEKRLSELNISYDINSYFSRPTVDISLQSEQLNDAIAWKPDYLIYTLDALRHQAMIERILLRGKPKLILQNITTPLQQWQQLKPFLYTGFDHEKGTQLLANQMLNQHPQGTYSMLYFSQGYVSQMRGDTFTQQAANNTDLKLVSSYYTKGISEIAYKATLASLKKTPDLNMIFACSTDIALGALKALDENNLSDQVTLNGWGGGDREIEALLEGKLDLTVMRMNDDSSVAMAEAIKMDISGQSSSVPHIYSGDIVLLSKNTHKDEIEQLKKRAFRYSSNGQ